MKAIFLTRFGSPEHAFQMKEINQPKPKSNEVLIEVEAFGLNYAEVMARLGLYPDSPNLPFVPGYDAVGKVVDVGKDVDSSLMGKRVAALTRFGSYAEFVVTNSRMIVEIPNEMSASEGTAIGVQYNTAYYMSQQALNLFPGDRVLIRAAAGGVGTALIQLCQWKKAHIVGMAGSDEKCDLLKKSGIDDAVNYKDSLAMNRFEEKYGKDGFDVVFNPVAGKSFKVDFQLLKPGGRMVLFGASSRASRKRGKLPTMKLLWDMGILIPITLIGQSKSIIGVNMMKIASTKPEIIEQSMSELIKLYQQGVVQPKIGAKFNAKDINAAHSFLESGNSTGKVVVHW